MNLSLEILSELTCYMKYARYLSNEKRRETWEEIVTRNKNMHIENFPFLAKEIEDAYKLVYEKKVLPSMRGLQFASKPIKISPARSFNCSFVAIDHWKVFSEICFLLLSGCGVGYSVQNHHIEQLPEVKTHIKRNRRFLVADSIEGWADAIKVLTKSYFFGQSKPIFDFSDVRPKGAPLITSGGKAPGPQPLKDCIYNLSKIFDAKEPGTKLTSLECHNLVCHIADCVLSGGIRRAALISLFSVNDEKMLTCKHDSWWELNPQLGRANNSAVILRHKVTKKDFTKLFERIKESRCGEPGIALTNDKDWGMNPSLRAGTKVLTNNGCYPIEELQDKGFYVCNLTGEVSYAECWQSSPCSDLYEIELVGGHKYYATKEHQWPVKVNGKIVKKTTESLQVLDELPILQKDQLFAGNLGTYQDGFVLGWQIGNGWLTQKLDTQELQHGFVVHEKDNKNNIQNLIIDYIRKLGSTANFSEYDVLYTSHDTLTENLEKFGGGHKSNGLPQAVWRCGTESFRKGIIDGLISSSGSVEDKKISFTSKYQRLTNDLSELLGFYGIKSTVEKTIVTVNFNYSKTYERYTLTIEDNQSIKHFKKLFTLIHQEKQSRLDNYQSNDTEQLGYSVKAIRKTEFKEPVWDISVYDDTHCFNLAHCVTGNCGEVALRAQGQFCNLSTFNVSDIEDQADLNNRAAAAAFIGTLQASYTNFHYLRDVWKKTTEKEALIGVSMTGIASGKVLECDLTEAAEIVKEENERVANLIGIKVAARTTCVKPEGTASLVVGSSSGIHSWFAPYYIRRIRVFKNEPIYQYLKQKLPALLEDDFFKAESQAVISIPVKAPEGAIFSNEPAINLLERIKKVYTEWIKPGHRSGENTHNVSSTVYVGDDEWDVVAKWMWENRNYYTGITVLPKDGGTYKQAPFEAITKERYEELIQSLVKIDLSEVNEDSDNTIIQEIVACSGDSCNIL